MKRFILTHLMCIVGFFSLYAQMGEINPTSPGDPGAFYRLSVEISPQDAGTVNIKSRMVEYNEKVRLSINTIADNYTFKHWTSDGTVISTSQSFDYYMPMHDAIVVAEFDYTEPVEEPFDPESPGDPQTPDIKVKHLVTIGVSPVDGGSVSASKFYLAEEDSKTVTATANVDYVFVGWQLGEEIVSMDYSLSFTMGTSDLNYIALFDYQPVPFDPESPDDPGANIFDPFTGRLIINRFKTGNLQSAITKALNGHERSEVSYFQIIGELSTADLSNSNSGFAYNMSNCDTIDLRRTTGYTELPSHTFSNLGALQYVALPQEVNTLNRYAFYSCNSLDSVVISDNFTTIHDYAFYDCDGLHTIFWNASKITKLPSYLGNSLNTLVFGDNIEIIPNSFCGNTSSNFYDLTKVVLGKNVTIIDDYAFSNTGVEELIGNDKLDSIGQYAFSNTGFSSIKVPANVRIGSYAYADIENLKKIDLEGVEILPDYLFAGCSELEYVEFPNTLTLIGENAFNNCNSLESILWDASQLSENPLRGNIQYSYWYTTYRYSSINTIIFGEHITTIPEYFCGTKNNEGFENLNNVVIGKNVTSIGDYAFLYSPLEMIEARPVVPPVIGDGTLDIGSDGCLVNVPCGSETAYQAAWVSDVLTIEEDVLENYDIYSDNILRGFIEINQYPNCDDHHVKATATPEDGFKFAYWNEPENSVNPLYFELSQDTVFVAYFTSLYRAIFMNYDGTELLNIEYIIGEDPVYTGEVPTAESNEQYSYLFREWKHEVDHENGNQLYYAQYDTLFNDNVVITSLEYTGTDWNNLSASHPFSVEGYYGHAEALKGMIQYAVEDEEWQDMLADSVEAFNTFSATVSVTFRSKKQTHRLRFRAVDSNGHEREIATYEYLDIRDYLLTGLEDKTYNGEAQVQTNLQSQLESAMYTVSNYKNNINAGTASFRYNGVYPYSIGSQTYNFTILPLTLTGSVVLEQETFVYTGSTITTTWHFSNEAYSGFRRYYEYDLEWKNNRYPGLGTLTVTGINNYTGTLTANIHINKAPVNSSVYSVTFPQDVVIFDGHLHGANATVSTGVGNPVITYHDTKADTTSMQKPKYKGTYEIFLAIGEGDYYLALENQKIGEFTIVSFDDEEWEAIQAIHAYMVQHDQANPWDLSSGMDCVPTLEGLTITNAHITGLDLSNGGISGDFPYVVFKLSYLQNLNLSGNNFSGDIETGLSAYMSSPDYPGVQSIESIDISSNNFTGNLGAFAAIFPELNRLMAQNNHIENIYPMISVKVETLNISNQVIIGKRVLDMTEPLNKEQLIALIPTIMLYNHSAQNYTPTGTFSVMDQITNPQWNAYISISGNDWSWYTNYSNVFRFTSDDELWLVNSKSHCQMPLFISFRQGDADFSSSVDVLDLQAIINYLFDDYSVNKPFNHTASDLYADNMITVQDIVLLVDLLLADEQAAYMSSHRIAAREHNQEKESMLTWKNGELHLFSEKSVAAIDITVRTDSEIEWLVPSHFITTKATTDGQHAIIYSLLGNVFPSMTDIVIARSTDKMPVTVLATLSDIQANRISVGTETIPNEVPTDIENAAENGWKVGVIGGNVLIYSTESMDGMSWRMYDMQGNMLWNGIVNVDASVPVVIAPLPQSLYCILILNNQQGEIVLSKKIIK